MLVDDRLMAAAMTKKGELELQFAAEDAENETQDNPLTRASCAVRIDFDNGTVTGEQGLPEVLEPLLSWLATELDDDLVATLRQAAAEQRDRRPAKDPWDGWQPGDLVHHADFFPAERWAPFSWRGKSWLVEDLHCIEPRCPCMDVRLVFGRAERLHSDPVPTFAGTLVVTLPTMTTDELEVENGHLANRDELRELWNAFRAQRPDLGAELATRRTQAKALKPQGSPVVRGAKVGRNDPCPCGSGKKHKKCCDS